LSKLHHDLAAILRKHLGPKPRVSAAVAAAINELNATFWANEPRRPSGPVGEVDVKAELLQVALESTMDCIALVDQEGRIIAHNRRFVELWNIPDYVIETGEFDAVLPHVLFELRSPEILERHLAELEVDASSERHEVLEFVDGRYFELNTVSQVTPHGKPARAWSFRDVSQIKRAEEAFRHDAFHDTLTGLPNRALFSDRLRQAMAAAQRCATKVGIMFMDLDRFKSVNDTLGHGAGDELLKLVSSRLRGRVRAQDTVSRLAGDEFMVLITNLKSDEAAVYVAESILDTMQLPFRIEDHALKVGASIGVSLYPDHGDEPDELMKHADVALYQAKEEGRNRYKLYHSGMSNASAEKMVFENDLRQAIAEDHLVVHYQPIVDLKSGRIEAVEALVRWRREDDTLIPPDRFIPVAEGSGLIGSITEWVLKTAGSESQTWPMRPDGFHLSVNFSAQQFWDPHLVVKIERQLGEAGIEPSELVVELTETTIMQDPVRGVEPLKKLRDMGVGVALDDFGTGHSSLAYLRHMPVNTLKIDRSFITRCNEDARDGAIVSAIIRMAKSLQMRVIAEGVEEKTQAQFLGRHGCDAIQGYWFSPPVPSDQLVRVVSGNWSRARPTAGPRRHGFAADQARATPV
jgi:diguanylate cyclase (GGDEF)-like protein